MALRLVAVGVHLPGPAGPFAVRPCPLLSTRTGACLTGACGCSPFGDRPGSPWWRAVNERILRDGCEAVGLSGGLAGPASSRTVDHWLSFADHPTARAWYRAHNGSVVAAYLENRDLAEAENETERFFMNVVLCRVLYAHALVAAPRISLARCVRSPRSSVIPGWR
ncbi:hypothetical protein [Streptomyces sp. NPDC093514]|uniref:hypothetical protein n=1 Tax=Streptomyces sp. NPDC093514 TaxID=3366039 RepID=UPI0038041191